MTKRRPDRKGLPVRLPKSLQGRYDTCLADISEVLQQARRTAARSVNAIITAAYWLTGRRIVELEQEGKARARYGEAIMQQLASDLGERFGRGFGKSKLYQMRAFYLAYADILQTASGKSRPPILQTVSGQSPTKAQTSSAQSVLGAVGARFPLPWSAYVRLLSVSDLDVRAFYQQEALRGGWSVRQLDRQISTGFYERTLASRNRTAMLRRGARPKPGEVPTPEQEIRDPYVLEFLDLKDEYSESDLEDALISRLEMFLLELGGDFAFIGRQKRLRIGDEWYRVDLVFFHRHLRCLIVIDLKIGKFAPADAGQMHLYLNYARQHWTRDHENPPVGLILCAQKDRAVARYALEGLPNKVLAAEYKLALPNEKALAEELKRAQKQLDVRR